MSKFSTIKKVNEHTFETADYEQFEVKKTFHIKYTTIILVFIVIAVVIWSINSVLNNINKDTNITNNTSEILTTTNPSYNPFSSDGFVFTQSSSEKITMEEINELQSRSSESDYTFQELLRFSVNEIYARHGFKFSGGKFDHFYSQFNWYKKIKKTDVVTWDKFNEYEQFNIALLVKIEKQNGFIY